MSWVAGVTWASMASREAMGLQRYELSVQQALLRLAPQGLDFRTVSVSSMRDAMSGARRVPTGWYHRAPLPFALGLGGLTYRTTGLVHRFDLRLPPSPGPEVVTIHDLPPERFDDEGSLPRSAAAGARRARLVLVPSQFAADEVTALLGVDPSRVRVVPNGVEQVFLEATGDGHEARSLGIEGRYVVHAAGATSRKNLAALARAWSRIVEIEPELHLVLCGPPDDRRTRLFGGLPRTSLVGLMAPGQVAALMGAAAAVVVPSVYEGFGLPVLEGMAAGVPVVAARRGALPEICGPDAILVEPDPTSLANGLLRVVGDRELARDLGVRGRTRAARFTWRRSAIGHLDAYREAHCDRDGTR